MIFVFASICMQAAFSVPSLIPENPTCACGSDRIPSYTHIMHDMIPPYRKGRRKEKLRKLIDSNPWVQAASIATNIVGYGLMTCNFRLELLAFLFLSACINT